MITRIFSIFDPSSSIINLAWITIILPILIVPLFLWRKRKKNRILLKFFSVLKKEIEYVIKDRIKGTFNLIRALFIILLIINLTALIPYIFSATSHIVVNAPIAYSLWLSIILFSWAKSLKSFIIHLVPTGTPLGLIRFIILVEILRNIIRPLALTFRLTANLIAGHLLISLIGDFLIFLPLSKMLIGSTLQIILTIIEIGVALIQAYVIVTLLLLYLSETE